MAGLIKREDIDAVRERIRIEDVVGEHVTLKSGGAGSMKGLCPFHDERTPSFHVRPQLGLFHCFGCGESGDVISFVQKIDHLPFAEAVEAALAATSAGIARSSLWSPSAADVAKLRRASRIFRPMSKILGAASCRSGMAETTMPAAITEAPVSPMLSTQASRT